MGSRTMKQNTIILTLAVLIGALTSCRGSGSADSHPWPQHDAECKKACAFGGATRHQYSSYFGCQCADDNGNLWQVQRCN